MRSFLAMSIEAIMKPSSSSISKYQMYILPCIIQRCDAVRFVSASNDANPARKVFLEISVIFKIVA